MVKTISQGLARSLERNLSSNKIPVEVLAYGLEILLCSSIKIIAIMTVAYLLGIFDITLFYLASFILIRRFGGGVHLSTYGRCLSAGLMSTIACALIVHRVLVSPTMLLWLSMFLSVLGGISIFLWVPAGTHKKEICGVSERRKLKWKTVLIGIFLFSIVAILSFYHYYNYALSMVLGGFMSFYLITPIGYKTIYAIEYIINAIQKEGREKYD